MNPIFLIDFYKVGHVSQYPAGVTQVWSNWTPRSTHVKPTASESSSVEVIHFGLSYLIQRYLIQEFRENFFRRNRIDVISEYRHVIFITLGDPNPRTDHIEWLHGLGYLPIKIYAIPEGESTPLGVPHLVITNTLPEGFWIPNYLETLLSAILWKPSTSATTAARYRRLFERYARQAGETDMGFVDYMGHDFSMRGMSGVEDAILSGMGHLLSFKGTDSLPALLAAQQYYQADLTLASVPATEHSVMSAGSPEGELETFRRLLKLYPAGPLSVVSDTWDLWKVLTEYLPALREEIFARQGKLVIRPDSGDPVQIICGTATGKTWQECAGVASLLRNFDTETVNSTGRVMLNHTAMIYGDSITVDRADQILTRLLAKGFSPYNMVFGIGSFTYEYVTRDTYGFAMKATAIRMKDNPEIIPIYKDPVTDTGAKKSARGIPIVDWASDGNYCLKESVNEQDLDNCCYSLVFQDGRQLIKPTFAEIRQAVHQDISTSQEVTHAD